MWTDSLTAADGSGSRVEPRRVAFSALVRCSAGCESSAPGIRALRIQFAAGHGQATATLRPHAQLVGCAASPVGTVKLSPPALTTVNGEVNGPS
jgi:hypothetical protein